MTREEQAERAVLKRALDWRSRYLTKSSMGNDALLIHLDYSKLWEAIGTLAGIRAKAANARQG